MNVNSRGHNLDTRFKRFFLEIKHPPGHKSPVGVFRVRQAGGFPQSSSPLISTLFYTTQRIGSNDRVASENIAIASGRSGPVPRSDK